MRACRTWAFPIASPLLIALIGQLAFPSTSVVVLAQTTDSESNEREVADALPSTASEQVAKTWTGSESIASIQLTLTLDEDSPDLTESVALDLGIGFPVWLVFDSTHRASEDLPWGAVAPSIAPRTACSAGEPVTYLLQTEPSTTDPALDRNAALLEGIRTGDISRVGIASGGSTNWKLASYSLKINGTLLAERSMIAARAGDAIAAARAKLRTLEAAKLALDRQEEELTAWSSAGLATPRETEQLANVRAKSNRLNAQTRRLNAIVQGVSPWFIDDQFESILPPGELVENATVTIVNGIHVASGTADQAFFSTGGRKYLLNESALTSPGPHTFTLDLDAGPLGAAQLRGWAIGSLASKQNKTDIVDRWHPQRLVVSLDGIRVYDSDQNAVDRKSLDAIRIVPPAHYDQSGQLVTHQLAAYETNLWTSGHALGLDLAGNTADSLPDLSETRAPGANTEFGPSDESPPSPPLGTLPAVNKSSADDTASLELKNSAQFADETAIPGTLDASQLGLSDSLSAIDTLPAAGQPSNSDGIPPIGPSLAPSDTLPSTPGTYLTPDAGAFLHPSGTSGNADPGGSLSGGPSGNLFGSATKTSPLGTLPTGSDPPPAGKPFQIKSVTISQGYRSDDKFTIRWTVSGEESSVLRYVVALRGVRPDQQQPYLKRVMQANVAAGTHQYTGSINANSVSGSVDTKNPLFDFLAPEVVAIPKDSTQTPHVRFGPARPLFQSAQDMPLLAPLNIRSQFDAERSQPPGSSTTHKRPIVWGKPPAQTATNKIDSAVWVFGADISHSAVMFADPKPAWNVAARTGTNDKSVNLQFQAENLRQGTYRLVAYFGFLGKGEVTNNASVQMRSRLYGKDFQSPKWTGTRSAALASSAAGQATALQRLEQLIDTSQMAETKIRLHVNFVISGGKADPEHPPALFGIRLVPTRLSKFPLIPAEVFPSQKADVWISGLPSSVRTGQSNQILIHVQQDGKPLAGAKVSIQASGGTFISTGQSTVQRGPHITGKDGVWANTWTPQSEGIYTFHAQAVKDDFGGSATTTVRVVKKDQWPSYYKWPSNYPKFSEPGWSDELQDLTHDDKHWYFSRGNTYKKLKIWKFPITHDLNAKVAGPDSSKGILAVPIPTELAGAFNHFGGLDYYQGNLYVALEAIGCASTPKVVVFRASDLKMLGHADLITTRHRPNHLPYVAVDPRSGLLYSSGDEGVTELTIHRPMLTETKGGYRFKLQYVGRFPLVDAAGKPITVNSVQSADITENGHLYLVSNDHQTGGIYGFSLIEKKQLAFIPVYWKGGSPNYEELEGIDIWDVERPGAPKFPSQNWGGQVHLLILDNDLEELPDPLPNIKVDVDDFHIRHWRVSPADLDKL